jgi:hypothetical protein
MAVHDYGGEGEGELTFHNGEIIQILEQKRVDPGWLKGSIRGDEGVFPAHYVQVVHPERCK